MNLFSRLFVVFILGFFTTKAQLPAQLRGINPASVSKSDLDQYGVSQSDLERLLKEYGGSTSSSPTPAPVKEEVVVKTVTSVEEEVKPDNTPEADVKDDLYVYGRNLFSNKNLKVYESASHIKAPSNYILGIGDEISISIWGYSEHSGVYRVEDDGNIKPRLVGNIPLKGLSFDKAQSIIKSRFGGTYDLTNSQISIELNYSKVIRVNIVGEVKNPGTYSVPAINSAFNILSLAGGINQNGTVRNIQIRREGKVIKTLDVYQFLKNPDYVNDFFLMENDYIVVGNVGNVVTLNGRVKREEKYELKENEGITELMEYAGGILASAYTPIINVFRYQDNMDILIEIPFDSLRRINQNFILKDGDRITVKAIPNETRNRVSANGELNLTGSFLFTEGMTVKDLVHRAEGFKTTAYLPKAYIVRLNEDLSEIRMQINLLDELNGTANTLLMEFDELIVYSKKKFLDEFSIEVKGLVRNPNTFTYTTSISLGDALFLAGGIKKEAAPKRVEIARIFDLQNKEDDAHVIVESIEIDSDILSKKNRQIKLFPGDIITVRKVPLFEKQQIVTIEGEIRYSGTYTIAHRDEKILDLIERAGGLTNWAFLEGAYIERNNEVKGKGMTVLDLKKLITGEEKRFNYILRAGDKIVIPRTQDFIKLSGAVKYPKVAEFGEINMPVHHKNKRAKFYINRYGGGFHKNAKRSKTYIETPGGYVKRTINLGIVKIYPKVRVGDEIYVLVKDEKVKKERNEKDRIDWNRVIENTTVKLTGLATLWVLLQRVNL